jgi:hypothetical protein
MQVWIHPTMRSGMPIAFIPLRMKSQLIVSKAFLSNLQGISGWATIQMVIVHKLLGEQNIVRDLPTWDKSRLGGANHFWQDDL